MARIIGLTGYGGKIAGVGKDTVADYLKIQYPDFTKVAFADPIREVMKVVFGWDDSHFQHPKKNEVDPKWGISPRRAMQTLGTEWGRNLIKDSLWVDIAMDKADYFLSLGYNVLVTDVRFDNEGDIIRAKGGTIWHIDRDIEGAGTEGKHVSELGVVFNKSTDVYIANNGTLGALFNKLDCLVEKQKGGVEVV